MRTISTFFAGNAAASSGSWYLDSFIGMAPNANIISYRVLDNSGSDSAVIAGIQQAIADAKKCNIRVMNLSLGRPVYESYTLDPLCQAVEQAWKAGIVVVVAAGNEGPNNTFGPSGYGTIMAPGNDPYVITAGAMKDMSTTDRNDDRVASYSSKGPTMVDHVVKPDLVAPGNRVISLSSNSYLFGNSSGVNSVPRSYYIKNGAGTSDVYWQLSGTSMAAPMVSGAAAVMLQKDPRLTPDLIKARLMKTATKTFPGQSIATDPVTGKTYTSQLRHVHHRRRLSGRLGSIEFQR